MVHPSAFCHLSLEKKSTRGITCYYNALISALCNPSHQEVVKKELSSFFLWWEWNNWFRLPCDCQLLLLGSHDIIPCSIHLPLYSSSSTKLLITLHPVKKDHQPLTHLSSKISVTCLFLRVYTTNVTDTSFWSCLTVMCVDLNISELSLVLLLPPLKGNSEIKI